MGGAGSFIASGCMAAMTGCEWRLRRRSAHGYRRGFWKEEREKKGERLFGQEYLCQFLQSEDCLFRQEDLDACFKDELEPIF